MCEDFRMFRAKNFAVSVVLLIPALSGAVPRFPETSPEVVRGDLERALDAYVRRAATFGFSGQVVVEVHGRVVLRGAYGFADPENGRPMTAETAVGVGSISKQFAAAAILSLAEAGRLSVDDSLGRFFPDAPADKRGITIHQLLTHTSGVTTPLREDFEARSRDELVESILAAPLRFEPGTDWSYSTAGYNLIAAIVEIAAGRPYGDYLREALFEPAGMTRTHLMDETAPGEDVARAHLAWDDRGTPAEWPRNWRNFGAGDVMSTAADLLRWERALRAGRVLSPESVKRMMSPQAKIDEENSYGYGFFLHGDAGGRMVEHGGDEELGYNASYYRYVDEGFVILITCTSRAADGTSLRHALGRPFETLLRGGTRPPPPEAGYPGETARPATFRGPDGSRLQVLSDGVHAWLAADGQAAVDALVGRAAEDVSDVERANRRTEALLAGLRERDTTAYPIALGPEGLKYLDDYRSEWEALVDSRGALRSFHIQGTTLGRTTASVHARLRFRDGQASMAFFWSDRSKGRLRGTFVEATAFRPPYAIPFGRLPDGGLVAWDPISGRTVHARVRDGRLTLEGSPAAWIEDPTPAGWTPPFRP